MNVMDRRKFLKLTFMGMACTAISASALTTLSGCFGVGASTKAADLRSAFEGGSDEVVEFEDSCGRTVALSTNIEKVSPSGAYAQILLCTLCPEKLISLSSNFSKSQMDYLDQCVETLPVLGRFYGKNGDMNYEEIIRMSPDVIIDIGEEKNDIADDMTKLQEQTGLPVIFVEATLTEIASAYRILGKLLDCEKRAEELASYVDETLEFAAINRDRIASDGLKVMYSAGPYGYDVKAQGTVHGAVLDQVGVDNVAKIEGTSSTEVSPEQVMVWAPEVLLLSRSSAFYDSIQDDETWAGIPAVRNNRVYEVPDEPYEWMDKPPSVQTVLGIKWLGNLLYPDVYDMNMIEETKRFYKLFWNYELGDDEVRAMLANSSLK